MIQKQFTVYYSKVTRVAYSPNEEKRQVWYILSTKNNKVIETNFADTRWTKVLNTSSSKNKTKKFTEIYRLKLLVSAITEKTTLPPNCSYFKSKVI